MQEVGQRASRMEKDKDSRYRRGWLRSRWASAAGVEGMGGARSRGWGLEDHDSRSHRKPLEGSNLGS